MSKEILAFDKSSRDIDVDGRMRVEKCNITKAMVCPYFGHEIPGAEALGLELSKIYYLFRDPEEIRKAADSFRGLPLLIKHNVVNADNPRKDLIVGTTGTDVEFNDPYLTVSLSIWDNAAIAGIETKQQTELSCGYRYTPDMTPGEYQGTHYDGVMRDIIGNHVALVDIGRAGSDVVVADSNPFIKDWKMKLKQNVITAKQNAREALKGVIALDADLTELDAVLEKLAKDADYDDESDDELYEDDPDAPGKRRKKATENEPAKPEGVSKGAMDAAIALATANVAKQVRSDMEALYKARKDVVSLVGEVAMDSAEQVYKFALDNAKVDTAGVHPSAYGALVSILQSKQVQAPKIGMDSAAIKAVSEQFPALSRFKHV